MKSHNAKYKFGRASAGVDIHADVALRIKICMADEEVLGKLSELSGLRTKQIRDAAKQKGSSLNYDDLRNLEKALQKLLADGVISKAGYKNINTEQDFKSNPALI